MNEISVLLLDSEKVQYMWLTKLRLLKCSSLNSGVDNSVITIYYTNVRVFQISVEWGDNIEKHRKLEIDSIEF